jgi:hypothetical protein
MEIKEEQVRDTSTASWTSCCLTTGSAVLPLEDVPALNLDWRAYIQLNRMQGALVKLFTARTDKLLGFVLYHVHEHLHHMSVQPQRCMRHHWQCTWMRVRHGVGRKLMEYR